MYITQVCKNGTQIHRREWPSEAAALRSAQNLATACRVTVRVIDTARQGGVILVRPIA